MAFFSYCFSDLIVLKFRSVKIDLHKNLINEDNIYPDLYFPRN
jgi:hypothetical protein